MMEVPVSKYNFLFQAVDAIAKMSPAEFDEATARLDFEYEARLAAGERDSGVVFGTVAWERQRLGPWCSAGYDFNLEPVTLVETARAAVGWCASQLLWRRCRRCLTWRRGSYCGGCGGFGHVVPDGRGRRRVAVSLAVAAAGIAAAGVTAVAAGVVAAGAAGAAAMTAAVVAALSLERARVAYAGDLSVDCLFDEQAAAYTWLIREVDEAPTDPSSDPFMSEFAKNVSLFTSTGELE